MGLAPGPDPIGSDNSGLRERECSVEIGGFRGAATHSGNLCILGQLRLGLLWTVARALKWSQYTKVEKLDEMKILLKRRNGNTKVNQICTFISVLSTLHIRWGIFHSSVHLALFESTLLLRTTPETIWCLYRETSWTLAKQLDHSSRSWNVISQTGTSI